MAALGESDPWKRFTWTFLALEVLLHRMAGRHYEAVATSLRSVGDHDAEVPAQALLRPLGRLTLSERFAVVALALRPDSALADIERFRVVKKVRDDMSHGGIHDAADLPIGPATELLTQYIRAALRLGGGL